MTKKKKYNNNIHDNNVSKSLGENATSTQFNQTNKDHKMMVNTYSLKPPVIDPNLPDMDNYKTLYERDILPIVRGSTIELSSSGNFLKTFNNPNLKNLSTEKICVEKKYTFVETVYLLYNNRMILDKKRMAILKKEDHKKLLMTFHGTFTHYSKRFMIIEAYLKAFRGLYIDEMEIAMCSAVLDVEVNTKIFYLNSFFKDVNDVTEKDLIDDLSQMLYKLKSKDAFLKKSLRDIYALISRRVMPQNFALLSNMEQIMCRSIADYVLSNRIKIDISKIDHYTSDIQFFEYFYETFNKFDTLRSIHCLNDKQRSQLDGYMTDIFKLIRLLLMNALTKNRNILVAVSRLEFLPKTTLINISLYAFLQSTECSNTVFSNIIKCFTKINYHLVNYFYHECTAHPHVMMAYMFDSDVKTLKDDTQYSIRKELEATKVITDASDIQTDDPKPS